MPSGNVTHVDGLRAVLVRDARMPEGYRILTAFPQAMKLDRRVMETPALEQLMGAYLHQDFGLVGDVADNIDAFMAEEPVLARRLPDEIAWALQIHDNAAELDAFVVPLDVRCSRARAATASCSARSRPGS